MTACHAVPVPQAIQALPIHHVVPCTSHLPPPTTPQQLLHDASPEQGPLESKLPRRKSSSCPTSSKLLHVPEDAALPSEEDAPVELTPRRSSHLSGTASLPAKLMTEAAAAEEEGAGGVAQTNRLDVQSTMVRACVGGVGARDMCVHFVDWFQGCGLNDDDVCSGGGILSASPLSIACMTDWRYW